LTEANQVRNLSRTFRETAPMPQAKIVNLDMHAIATLRHIRAAMDGAGSVAIPGSAGIAMGVIGLAAGGLSLLPNFASHWLLIWLVAAPIASMVGALLLTRSGSIATFAATGTPGRKLAFGLLPSLFAGAVMTAVLCKIARIDAIPGTWLLLYGCALVSASVSTTVIVAWMGVYFAGLGVLALASPVTFHVPLLTAGFGGLHIVFGILIARDAHGHET
jgi:hypothetical protein